MAIPALFKDMRNLLPLGLLLVTLVVAACDRPSGPPVAESWLGQWNGVEGTYLTLTKAAEDYRVTIANLDGPRTFAVTALGRAHIEFTRDGKTESLREGTGADTGMKWLADKKECLYVRAGEGYCRD